MNCNIITNSWKKLENESIFQFCHRLCTHGRESNACHVWHWMEWVLFSNTHMRSIYCIFIFISNIERDICCSMFVNTHWLSFRSLNKCAVHVSFYSIFFRPLHHIHPSIQPILSYYYLGNCRIVNRIGRFHFKIECLIANVCNGWYIRSSVLWMLNDEEF